MESGVPNPNTNQSPSSIKETPSHVGEEQVIQQDKESPQNLPEKPMEDKTPRPTPEKMKQDA